MNNSIKLDSLISEKMNTLLENYKILSNLLNEKESVSEILLKKLQIINDSSIELNNDIDNAISTILENKKELSLPEKEKLSEIEYSNKIKNTFSPLMLYFSIFSKCELPTNPDMEI